MHRFYFLIYNLLLTSALIVSWPYWIWRMIRRGGWKAHFGERFACYSKPVCQRLLEMNRPLWIHAVSVGEMMLVRSLIRELRKLKPDLQILLTTTTSTGRQVGQSLLDEKTYLIYAPLDLFWVARRAFRNIRPSMLILMEGELWPNWLRYAEKAKISVAILNARISDKSFKRYRLLKCFSKAFLSKINWVTLQSEEDRVRFSQVGYEPYKLFTVGSMKVDLAMDAGYNPELAPQLCQLLGWNESNLVFMAGSTHAGEEEILLKIYQSLRTHWPDLKFVLAPRHAERASSLLKLNLMQSFKTKLRSQLSSDSISPTDIMILDTTGELRSIYPIATVIVIGKSFIGYGGQNFVEAARFKAPVLFGPHMENFASLAKLFLSHDAVAQVGNPEALEIFIQQLLEMHEKREKMSDTAHALLHEHVGAAARNAAMVISHLNSVKQ